MSDTAGRSRLRLNLGGNEIEIEGPDGFIQAEVQKLGDLVKLLGGSVSRGVPPEAGESPKRARSTARARAPRRSRRVSAPSSSSQGEPAGEAGGFKEWLPKMPERRTNRIKLLWAGYFLQRHSPAQAFTVRGANELLESANVGVKHPNPEVLNMVNMGLVERVSRGEYRLTKAAAEDVDRALQAG